MRTREEDLDSYVPLDEAATRMALPVERVLELIEQGALRAYRYAGWGEILVQPAILSGAVPKKKARSTRPPRKRV